MLQNTIRIAFGGAILFALLFASPLHAQDVITPVGEVELVQDGFTFTEGPAWDPETETLYFSDIPNRSIFKLTSDGKISEFTTDSKHTNGILVTRDGRLLGCQMDGQLVEYNKEDASSKPLAATFAGRRFNAPNDLVMDERG
ncbi:MAG: SMP-30/gluconolactonase/LRE family protein, partial [Planctomycetota bacterium]